MLAKRHRGGSIEGIYMTVQAAPVVGRPAWVAERITLQAAPVVGRPAWVVERITLQTAPVVGRPLLVALLDSLEGMLLMLFVESVSLKDCKF